MTNEIMNTISHQLTIQTIEIVAISIIVFLASFFIINVVMNHINKDENYKKFISDFEKFKKIQIN